MPTVVDFMAFIDFKRALNKRLKIAHSFQCTSEQIKSQQMEMETRAA